MKQAIITITETADGGAHVGVQFLPVLEEGTIAHDLAAIALSAMADAAGIKDAAIHPAQAH